MMTSRFKFTAIKNFAKDSLKGNELAYPHFAYTY